MPLDDSGDDAEPEAGALADVLGGEERIEDAVDLVLRNAAAVVGHANVATTTAYRDFNL